MASGRVRLGRQGGGAPMAFMAVGLMVLAGGLAFCVFYLAFAPRWRVWVRVAITTLVMLALAAALGSLLIRPADYPMATWRPVTVTALVALPVMAYLGLGLVGVAAIDLLWRGAARVRRETAASTVLTDLGEVNANALPRRVVFLRWATCLVTTAAIGVTTFGYVRAHEPVVTPVDVTSPQLPSPFDGYRIALLTDIHIGPGLSGGFLRQVVDETNAAQPDLVVIAGDLVDGSVAQLIADMAPLADLRAPDGVVVVTGNHELYTGMPSAWMAAFRTLGLTVLDNDGVVLHRGDSTIDVLGIGDRNGAGLLAPDLTLADWRLHQTAGPPSAFRILAVHEPLEVLDDGHGRYVAPDGVGLGASLGVDLALCGHTHGGQMWPVQALIRRQQPVLDGVHNLAGVTTVTSRGAGAWGPPVRIGAPPEIPLITLHVAA